MDGLPCHKEYNLTYCPQITNTDCGLTCVSMLLEPSSKQFLIDNLDEIRTAAGFGHSTWTIDLCYVLRRFNVKFVYFTKTIGVDESRISDPNYEKSCAKDKSRVKRRFMEAESNGISIDKRTVELSALVRHLANDGPLILLINDSTLECGICRKKKVKDNVKYEHRVFFTSMPSSIYLYFPLHFRFEGHFVLVCGYDMFQKHVLYYNPHVEGNRKYFTSFAYLCVLCCIVSNGLLSDICTASFKGIEHCRKTYGTDEDIIFIYW